MSNPNTLPETIELPLLPLRDVVVFPHMVIPLFVGRPKSIKALEMAMDGDKRILLIAQKSAAKDEPEPEENKELKMLMASFRSLLPQQVDVLLVPFKAKQLLAHLLSELNEEQISMAEAFLKELLFKNIDNPTFTDRLDLDLEKGGAGWNRLRAESFSGRVQEILSIAQKLKDDPAKSATLLAEYEPKLH